MLVPLAYNKVASEWREIRTTLNCPSRRGLHVDEVAELLLSLTGNTWEISVLNEPAGGYKATHPLEAILTWQGPGYTGHWMAMKRGVLYDPLSDEPALIENSYRMDHKIIRSVWL